MVAADCARAYRANAVLTAPPGQLVLILYDGALSALATARAGFARPASDIKRFEVINRGIRKARDIIAELQSTLNFDVDNEFATTMHRLYDYYNRRLFEANVQKVEAPVIEIEKLLGELRDAWAEMLRKPQQVPPAGRAA